MLPQLRKLEQAFTDELVVIGVHAGKFIAERVTENIREAARRLDIDHPIVNDRQFRTWRAYAVDAWPTITLIDADGRVVAQQAGEIPAEAIIPVVERLIADARASGSLAEAPVALHDGASSGDAASGAFDVRADRPGADGGLRFPAKVAVSADRLCIADTGNHRILFARLSADGRSAAIEGVVGGTAGFADGAAGSARFRDPLGVCFAADGTVYVADAGNHAIRAVDSGGAVRTVAGTGDQAKRPTGPGGADHLSTDVALNSPWDVLEVAGMLYVAMAGWHQLWRVDPRTGGAGPWVGSLAEALVDGPPATAALAQPSGLARHGRRLYFADAESSAIRWADLDSGETSTVVGTGLFDFGDRDGTGDAVRLQHALGVAVSDEGILFVADTYNGRIKRIDPATREAKRFAGNDDELWEPGGLARAGDRLLVADTNHHRIATVDANGRIETLQLIW